LSDRLVLLEPDRLKTRIFWRYFALLLLSSLLVGGALLLSGRANTADAKTPDSAREQLSSIAHPSQAQDPSSAHSLGGPQGSATPTETPPPSCSLAWRLVSSPNPGDADNLLQSIAVISTGDVWSVGFYQVGSLVQTLTMHWDGSQWTVVPSPNVGTDNNFLTRVSAVAAN